MASAPIYNNLMQNEYLVVPKKPENVESHTMVLDSYILAYTDHARIARLIYISEVCPSLRVKALQMAIDYVKRYTTNLTKYEQLIEMLKKHNPIGAAPDGEDEIEEVGETDAWLEKTSKSIVLEHEQLEAEIKVSKVSGAMQMGYERLAEHYLRRGDLLRAYSMYSHGRDHCTTHRDAVNMCNKMVLVAIYLEKWDDVIGYVTKALKLDPTEPLKTLLHCAGGLAEMCLGHYRNAAEHFVLVNIDHCEMSNILSRNNVSVYGGLCALATFDRAELQIHAFGMTTFKRLLEIEPLVQEALISFDRAEYSQCLKILQDMRENLLLDIYIGPHVQVLHAAIRKRGLIQYAPSPWANIEHLAATFNTDEHTLRRELDALAISGDLEARIDGPRHIIHMCRENNYVMMDTSILISLPCSCNILPFTLL